MIPSGLVVEEPAIQTESKAHVNISVGFQNHSNSIYYRDVS
jgi:hypothetical protein